MQQSQAGMDPENQNRDIESLSTVIGTWPAGLVIHPPGIPILGGLDETLAGVLASSRSYYGSVTGIRVKSFLHMDMDYGL